MDINNILTENQGLEIIPVIADNLMKKVLVSPFRSNMFGTIVKASVQEYLKINLYGEETIIFKDDCEKLINFLLEHMPVSIDAQKAKHIYGDSNAETAEIKYCEYRKKAEAEALAMEWKKAIFIVIEG